jgi:hypothetical protein
MAAGRRSITAGWQRREQLDPGAAQARVQRTGLRRSEPVHRRVGPPPAHLDQGPKRMAGRGVHPEPPEDPSHDDVLPDRVERVGQRPPRATRLQHQHVGGVDPEVFLHHDRTVAGPDVEGLGFVERLVVHPTQFQHGRRPGRRPDGRHPRRDAAWLKRRPDIDAQLHSHLVDQGRQAPHPCCTGDRGDPPGRQVVAVPRRRFDQVARPLQPAHDTGPLMTPLPS